MGLFDEYFDPEQFQASGGLLGRLLSLPQMQGLYRPNVDDLDPAPSERAVKEIIAKSGPYARSSD